MRIFFYLALFFCSVYSFSQDFQYSSLLIKEELKDNADAVVRFDEMVVDILAQDNMLLKSKRVVTVLNKNGNKHVNAYAGYSNSSKVKYIKAIVYDAFGNEIKKIKEKDFKDVSAVSGGTLYSDYRVKYLDYTPTGYPYTIVLEKEIQTKNTAFLPTWNFLDGYGVSAELSHFKLNFVHADLKPRVLEKNTENYNIEINETPLSIDCKGVEISALKKEQLSPMFNQISPKIMTRLIDFHYEGHDAHVENWEQLGEWMYVNLLQGRSELPESVKSHITNLVKNVDSDIEKARLVYEYMQSVTRYISVQVGIGGIQPIIASEVDRVKYGDCKGLSNYTHALLEVAGVKSYYVHVEAGNNKIDFEEDFPTLAQGNHAILAIPNGESYTWIDCTSQTHPFGFVGDFTDDRKAFVIRPNGGEVIKTPVYLNENNSQKMEGEIQLLEDGAIKVSAVIETKGIRYDNRFYIEDLDKDKILEYYQDTWASINNLILEKNEFKNDKEKVKFTEEVQISAKNYAKPSGERILFSPNVLNKNSFVPKRYRTRKLPFQIQRGYKDVDSYVISIPEGYGVEALPEPVEIISEFGEYKMSVLKQGESLKYERRFLLKAGKHPKEKYSNYRSFRKKISKNDGAQVVLIKK
ncbi:DUF3857 domain-containing protein [uncultured Maribacter sp.]|uniref:DUF3857 domain-containing protein n=1 Tax=uncultured Maribacter sp. TaxID=431308 RepID=UPI00260BF86D|nr:DUF3857 domain-containing protein [uncultured Maribacter sp.]